MDHRPFTESQFLNTYDIRDLILQWPLTTSIINLLLFVASVFRYFRGLGFPTLYLPIMLCWSYRYRAVVGSWNQRATKTLGYSHVLKAKQIAKRVNIENLVLREPNAGIEGTHLHPSLISILVVSWLNLDATVYPSLCIIFMKISTLYTGIPSDIAENPWYYNLVQYGYQRRLWLAGLV